MISVAAPAPKSAGRSLGAAKLVKTLQAAGGTQQDLSTGVGDHKTMKSDYAPNFYYSPESQPYHCPDEESPRFSFLRDVFWYSRALRSMAGSFVGFVIMPRLSGWYRFIDSGANYFR